MSQVDQLYREWAESCTFQADVRADLQGIMT